MNNTQNINLVKELLGHDSIRTSERYYLKHDNPELLRDSHNTLAGVFLHKNSIPDSVLAEFALKLFLNHTKSVSITELHNIKLDFTKSNNTSNYLLNNTNSNVFYTSNNIKRVV